MSGSRLKPRNRLLKMELNIFPNKGIQNIVIENDSWWCEITCLWTMSTRQFLQQRTIHANCNFSPFLIWNLHWSYPLFTSGQTLSCWTTVNKTLTLFVPETERAACLRTVAFCFSSGYWHLSSEQPHNIKETSQYRVYFVPTLWCHTLRISKYLLAFKSEFIGFLTHLCWYTLQQHLFSNPLQRLTGSVEAS